MRDKVIQKPDELVRDLIQAMYEWEVWSCMQEDLAEEGELDESVVSESIREQHETILERFRVADTARIGLSYGDPPEYHPAQTIVSVELENEDAIVIVRNSPER
ncbi:MAG: NTF2 fold immunity protein [Phycisphaeraceae bacterium]